MPQCTYVRVVSVYTHTPIYSILYPCDRLRCPDFKGPKPNMHHMAFVLSASRVLSDMVHVPSHVGVMIGMYVYIHQCCTYLCCIKLHVHFACRFMYTNVHIHVIWTVVKLHVHIHVHIHVHLCICSIALSFIIMCLTLPGLSGQRRLHYMYMCICICS